MTSKSLPSLLIAEPDPTVAGQLRQRLESARYSVRAARDTGEMLAYARNFPPDLFLVDVRLSASGTGEEMLSQLKAAGAYPAAILILPALEEGVVIRALRAGYLACVTASPQALDYIPEAVQKALEAAASRREAEEAWSNLTALVDLTGDAVLLVDAGGTIVSFNRGAEDLFGCAAAEALAANIDRFKLELGGITPGQRVTLRASSFHGIPLDLQVSYVETMSDGQPYRLVLARSAPAVTTAGGPATLPPRTITLPDVSPPPPPPPPAADAGIARARLRALMDTARALSDSKSMHVGIPRVLRTLGETLGFEVGGLWWVDHASDTMILGSGWASARFQNSKFKKTFHAQVFEMNRSFVGATCDAGSPAYVPDLTDRAHLPCSEAAVKEGLPTAVVFPVACEGDLRGAGVYLAPGPIEEPDELLELLGSAGAFIGEFLKRKDDQEALKRSQSQLLQSQKVDLLGQLAGGMAHNFNNQLNVIAGYCEYMLNSISSDTPLAKSVDKIQLASQRAARLTKQLLAFSRKESFQARRTDLNEVILQMEQMLARLISEDIVIETELAPGHLNVLADPTQLGQILVNLVVNSRDAMPKGGKVRVESAIETLESGALGAFGIIPPGEYARLSVIDNGLGMDEQTRQRVFEPFFTTKGPGTASGLGLSTVYGIVKAGDGHVQIDSQPGKGTTVRVYFPRLAGSASDYAPHMRPPATHKAGTILVVDDEKDIVEMVAQILTENGYTVLSASDGPHALEMAKKHEGPIHLAILDCVMPGMSGFQLARELTSTRPETRVIHVSGYTVHPIFKQGPTTPNYGMLEKPFSTSALLYRIKEILDRAG